MVPEGFLLALLGAAISPVIYSYVIYPVAVAGLARIAGHGPTHAQLADLPRVTVLIAAHNEAEVIGQRVQNALELDYPRERLEILIASDGSTDATEEIVSAIAHPCVTLLSHRPNRGKSFTLNRAIPRASGEVIVMSDANTRFAADAARRLVQRLETRDKPLAVCGKLVLVDPESGDNVDGLYWRFESWQKQNEGRLAATLGANGGIYAFRKDSYCPIPDNTIVDDMTIPLLMKLQHGGSVVYDESALAYEDAAPSMADEFGRRVRIGTGAYQSLRILWPLLHPRHGFTALAFFSHKLLRWFTPHLLLAGALIIIAGLNYPLVRCLGLLAVAVSALAWLGRGATGNSVPARILRLVSMFFAMNLALMIGFWRWLREEQSGTWKRTARESEP